jgi:uncharacterized protein DUF1566
MIRSRWSKWLSGVGGVVLIGGLVLANYGGGVTPAEADDDRNQDYNRHKQEYNHPNPFRQILGKLNEILAELNNGGRGGVGGAVNTTLRWDTHNPSASRFTVLTDFGGAAVRDNNTGLVWEQSPTTMATWTDARLLCIDKAVGGTRGWRLPSVSELTSLIDPSLPAPFVPAVFTGVEQMAPYWSATANADSTSASSKLSVNLQDGKVGVSSKSSANFFWCVRGPMSESAY